MGITDALEIAMNFTNCSHIPGVSKKERPQN